MYTRPLVGLLALAALSLSGVGHVLTQEKTPPANKVSNFTLKDFRGKAWSLEDVKDSKLVVLAFVRHRVPAGQAVRAAPGQAGRRLRPARAWPSSASTPTPRTR